ncbi:hypothetical protein BH23PSE1_BH23PSE1_13840 [soil metagenome]
MARKPPLFFRITERGDIRAALGLRQEEDRLFVPAEFVPAFVARGLAAGRLGGRATLT